MSTRILFCIVALSTVAVAQWRSRMVGGRDPYQWWDNPSFRGIHISDRANGVTHASYNGRTQYHYGYMMANGAAKAHGGSHGEALKDAWDDFKDEHPDRCTGKAHGIGRMHGARAVAGYDNYYRYYERNSKAERGDTLVFNTLFGVALSSILCIGGLILCLASFICGFGSKIMLSATATTNTKNGITDNEIV
eukprot:506643_1